MQAPQFFIHWKNAFNVMIYAKFRFASIAFQFLDGRRYLF
jgi:hypothetical protein